MTRKKDDPETIALKASIGLRLRALREVAGLSQAQFAAAIGEEQNAYQKWEKGRLFPNPKAMIAVCSRYNVDFNFLYHGDFEGLKGNLAAKLAQRLPSKYQ